MSYPIMTKLLAWLLFFLSATAQAAAFNHAGWDGLLKKHVAVLQGGQVTQVDYAGFKTDRAPLRQYLASTSQLSRAEFDKGSKHEQLAFLLNAYNAWTIDLVLNAYPDLKSIKDLGSLLQSPWKKRFIPLLGETRSLDDIEHTLIRGSGRYNDPRIHFAANCASIGCPALRAEAYVAERLDAQLEDAAKLFLSDRNRNRLDKDELNLSRIFAWYRDDFEKGWRGAHTLPRFLLLYREALGLSPAEANQLIAGEISLQFLDYDWRLNAKPKTGSPP